MILLSLLIKITVRQKNKRRFPFVPVLKDTCKNGKPCVVDYFDLETIDKKSSSHKAFKKCIDSAKLRKNHSSCFRRLNSYYQEKNGDAAFFLGIINEYGIMGKVANDTAAREYFEDGAAWGHAESAAELGFMLRYGFGGERDLERSVFLTEASAENGSISALLSLIYMYRYGLNMPKSCQTAYAKLEKIVGIVIKSLKFYRKLGNSGVTRVYRGNFPRVDDMTKESIRGYYEAEYGSDEKDKMFFTALENIVNEENQNITAAITKLKELKDVKYYKAYGILGLIYMEGIGVEINNETAKEYFYLGSQNDDATSIFKLGEMYYDDPDPKTKEKGALLIKESILNSCIEGYHSLGLHIVNHDDYFDEEDEIGITLINVSRKVGFLPSFYTSGILYANGFIGEPNCDEGFRLTMLAAELSPLFDDASVAYEALRKGDKRYSLRLYQRLADWGSEAAMWNSQQICQNLRLNSSDWFELQVKMNFHVALKTLAKRKLKEGDVEEAMSYLYKAAKNDAQAAFDYSRFLLKNRKINESLKYLYTSMSLRKSAFIACRLQMLLVYMKILPKGFMSLIMRKESDERYLLVELFNEYVQYLIFVAVFAVFSLLIWLKLKTMSEREKMETSEHIKND